MYTVNLSELKKNVCRSRLSVVCTTYAGGTDQDKSKYVSDLENDSTSEQEAVIWVSLHYLHLVSYAYNDTELKDVGRVEKLQ